MAQFDESKVINALHTEKAEVGKKYWFADSIAFLKGSVESNIDNIFVLEGIDYGNYPFREKGNNSNKQFIYPYEELTCRPYESTEEMINDFCERSHAKRSPMGEPFIWVKYKAEVNIAKCLITSFTDSFVYMSLKKYSLSELFDNFTYLDGSPCGKKIEA